MPHLRHAQLDLINKTLQKNRTLMSYHEYINDLSADPDIIVKIKASTAMETHPKIAREAKGFPAEMEAAAADAATAAENKL